MDSKRDLVERDEQEKGKYSSRLGAISIVFGLSCIGIILINKIFEYGMDGYDDMAALSCFLFLITCILWFLLSIFGLFLGLSSLFYGNFLGRIFGIIGMIIATGCIFYGLYQPYVKLIIFLI